jgi:hypothetical protein
MHRLIVREEVMSYQRSFEKRIPYLYDKRKTRLTSQGLAGSGSSNVKCPSTILRRSRGFFLHENLDLDLEDSELGRDPASGDGVGEDPPPESVDTLGVGQDSVALKSYRLG